MFEIPTRGVLTDHSGTTDGTDQLAVPASRHRVFLLIQNIGTGDIYVNFSGTASAAAGSILLTDGESLVFKGSDFIPTEEVHVFGTAGIDYTIKEG